MRKVIPIFIVVILTAYGPLSMIDELEEKTIEFTFEGVSYKRRSEKIDEDKIEWLVEDEFGNEVGEWKDSYLNHDEGWIEWSEDCYKEMHEEHEDYDENA